VATAESLLDQHPAPGRTGARDLRRLRPLLQVQGGHDDVAAGVDRAGRSVHRLVRDADRPDQSRALQGLQCLERAQASEDLAVAAVRVDQHDIEPVGLQSCERALDARTHVFGREVVARATVLEDLADLGADQPWRAAAA
jgi:hypothetical protein